MTSVQHVPVLIVGGGLVGLSAALFLNYHDVPYVLVERRSTLSVLPRSRGMHVRTAELYRQVGIEERINRVAATVLKAGRFGGASRGATVNTAEPLDISHLGAVMMAGAGTSPSNFVFLPQVVLEPVLADLARQRGGDLRFGVELAAFHSGADRVHATLRDRTGASTLLTADYVIAADGANSTVRAELGMDGWETAPTRHYINAFVRCDLTGVLGGNTFSQCDITGGLRGLVLSKNNTDEWSFHIEYDPRSESLADYPADRCAELVARMVGVPGIEVEVLARSAWDTGAFVADQYRRDRIFLAGDAAHRHAPWGGFGGNAGVADAHNLAWKLAAVLAGTAGDALLDSYAGERRPCAIAGAEQAALGDDFLTRYGIETPTNAGDLARRLSPGAVMERYRYASSAVLATDPGPSYVEELTGQPGTRVPHLWIDVDKTTSTLDLCGPGYTLLVAGASASWRDAAARAQRNIGIDIAVHALPDRTWTACTGLRAGGALLVRPDRHVAARSDEGLTPASLTGALRSINGLESAAAVA